MGIGQTVSSMAMETRILDKPLLTFRNVVNGTTFTGQGAIHCAKVGRVDGHARRITMLSPT